MLNQSGNFGMWHASFHCHAPHRLSSPMARSCDVDVLDAQDAKWCTAEGKIWLNLVEFSRIWSNRTGEERWG
jgi:hypothetical protein